MDFLKHISIPIGLPLFLIVGSLIAHSRHKHKSSQSKTMEDFFERGDTEPCPGGICQDTSQRIEKTGEPRSRLTGFDSFMGNFFPQLYIHFCNLINQVF